MSLAIVNSRAQVGIAAPPVVVEVHLAGGLPVFNIVGLPETAVKESKDRVRSAIINSNFEFPSKRITVNLAPADLPKEGGRYDLPIALGILVASGQVERAKLSDYEFVGELGLGGELRPIRGALPVSIAAANENKPLFVPLDNADEAALASHAQILAAQHLLEVCAELSGLSRLQAHVPPIPKQPDHQPDLSEIRGQESAKRALEVAVAGGHHLMMVGPPGSGKTMLANRLPGLMPDLSEVEAIETAAICSLAQIAFDPARWRKRPFRSPHHSASAASLVGGGSHPKPGEISLAHNGILFLDELPEFETRVLDQLREPLTSGVINISRIASQIQLPSRFLLVCAMNPCKCGFFGDFTNAGRCKCHEEQVHKYRSRISGPLMDRIDIQIEVPAVPKEVLRDKKRGERSEHIKQRVTKARERQHQRNNCLNNELKPDQLESIAQVEEAALTLLDKAMDKLGLSARAYHSIQRVSRTIADLCESESVTTMHIGEAVQYRALDRHRR